MFNFTVEEIQAMEKEIDMFCEKDIQRVMEVVENIFSTLEKISVDPIKRLAEVSSQEKWDKKSYGGDSLRDLYYSLAGGLEESVFSNMFYHFGLYCDHTTSGYVIPCIIVAKAMARDEKVALYVNAILSGSKKVNDIKDRWDSRSWLIYRILTSI